MNGRTLLNLLEKEASWMYRWSMASAVIHHQSGMGTDVEGRPIYFRTTYIERLRKEGRFNG
jgi:hypothetical protein